MLKREGKFPAMHVYACTLRSYEKFCAEERHPKNITASLSMQEIFTPERLKEYEDWLAGQQSSPNTISTYMRTLQAVAQLAGCHRAQRGTQSGAVQGCLYESGVAY
ncbi:MAG: phage integrase SAM-like domain-containing protein [Bacteroides cellulosilyticus]